jgi:multimeric flavodoxin WrbA
MIISGGRIMKVMLVNGSPHEKGCTYTALNEISKTLKDEGIESTIFWIGNKPVSGCIACGSCRETGRCAIKTDDCVNSFLDAADEYDGFVFGTPVHYASASGNMVSFMDRIFFSGGRKLYLKPAASVESARRGGTTATFDMMNKYYFLAQMPVIPGGYWNMVHGNTPDEVMQDKEGLVNMRVIARNMAWFLRIKDAADKAGVPLPKAEKHEQTNFIR